ncbi:MAG: hypothetical protein ACE5IY_19795, partial [bacterium]
GLELIISKMGLEFVRPEFLVRLRMQDSPVRSCLTLIRTPGYKLFPGSTRFLREGEQSKWYAQQKYPDERYFIPVL